MIINNLIKSNNSKLCSLTQTEKQKVSGDFSHKTITSNFFNSNPFVSKNMDLISFGSSQLSEEKLKEIEEIQRKELFCLKPKIHDFYPKRLREYLGYLPEGRTFKQFSRAKEIYFIKGRKNKQLNRHEIENIVKLSDKQFEIAKELLYIEDRGTHQFNGLEIVNLSKLTDTQLEKAKELLFIKERKNAQFTGYEILTLAKLPDDQFKKVKQYLYIKERGNYQFDGASILKLAKLPNEQFEKISKYLSDPELIILDYENMVNYSPDNIENYVQLVKRGFKKNFIDKIIQSVHEKYTKTVKKSPKSKSKYNIILAELKKANLEFTDKMGMDADNLSKVIKNLLFSQHLALINNLSDKQVMDMYGDKLKHQILVAISKLSSEQKTYLSDYGIEVDSLLQKLNAKADTSVIKQQRIKQTRTKQSLPEIERQIIDKFDVPQEIYQDEEKFDDFCKSKFEELINTVYAAKKFPEAKKITQKRNDILNDWKKLFEQEKMDYKNRLLITSSIIKNLTPSNKETPLQASIQTANEIINAINKRQNVSRVLTDNAVKGMCFSKVNQDGIKGEWVRIPSKINDPENFADNVNKLKALSLHNWCTHTFNAEPYLSMGDFYVFRSNSESELGVRFIRNTVEEIQGFQNNGTIPLPFVNIVKEFIEKNKFQSTCMVKSALEKSINVKSEFDELNTELEKLVKEKNYREAFKKLGIDVICERNGSFVINKYKAPSSLYRMEDLKVDKELWNQVCEVLDLDVSQDRTIRNLDVLDGKSIPWELLK